MENGKYRFHRRASATFRELPVEEQSQTLERLAELSSIPVRDWTPELARRISGEESLYLVKVNDSLRLMVQADDGEVPVVMDIVRRELLQFFADTAVQSGH